MVQDPLGAMGYFKNSTFYSAHLLINLLANKSARFGVRHVYRLHLSNALNDRSNDLELSTSVIIMFTPSLLRFIRLTIDAHSGYINVQSSHFGVYSSHQYVHSSHFGVYSSIIKVQQSDYCLLQTS